MLTGAGVWLTAAAMTVLVGLYLSWPIAVLAWTLVGFGPGWIMVNAGRLLRASSGPAQRPALFSAQFSLSHTLLADHLSADRLAHRGRRSHRNLDHPCRPDGRRNRRDDHAVAPDRSGPHRPPPRRRHRSCSPRSSTVDGGGVGRIRIRSSSTTGTHTGRCRPQPSTSPTGQDAPIPQHAELGNGCSGARRHRRGDAGPEQEERAAPGPLSLLPPGSYPRRQGHHGPDRLVMAERAVGSGRRGSPSQGL